MQARETLVYPRKEEEGPRETLTTQNLLPKLRKR
jgi:hypothetical protein